MTTGEELAFKILHLEQEVAHLRTQRDEARRLYCREMADTLWRDGNYRSPENIADEREWDCFEGQR